MAKAKTKALADLIGSGIAEITQRSTWWHCLPDEAREELADVRKRFHAGEYGPRAKAHTIARLLMPHCEAKGWKICDIKRLAEWLREKV